MKIIDPAGTVKNRLLPLLKNTLNDNLKSVVIYGSAASEMFDPENSDINVLVLLDRDETETLYKFGKKAAAVIKKYRLAILPLSVNDFISSSDVFPMEYNDIRDRNIVVYGENILDELSVTKENLRHQLEERLRGVVNQINRAVLNSAGNRRFLLNEIKAVPGIIFTLLRSALRLKGLDVKDMPAEKLYTEIKSHYSADFSFIGRTGNVPSFNVKDDGSKGSVTGFLSLLTGQLGIMISAIDSMDNEK